MSDGRSDMAKLFEEADVAAMAQSYSHPTVFAITDKEPVEPTGAMRFSENKLRPGLIPLELKIELARVYTIGGLKYEDHNWEKGMPYSMCVESFERHWLKWQAGLARDPDTGCHHLAQAIWNLTALLVYEMRGVGKDDRLKAAIDDEFNWQNPSAKELNLGLSAQEMAELREKYRPLREAARARKG